MCNLKNIKAVIFDMDGVLFDTERIYLEEWIEIFEKYGYKMTREIYVPLMGRGRKVIKGIFKERYGKDIPIEQMYKEKDKMLFEAVNNGIPMKEGAKELINFLKLNKYKIALATSAKRERMVKQLEFANLINSFDALVCSDDINNSKPDPEIFMKAADKLEISYSNCIVVEDSKAGIIAAKKANMIGLHVEDLLVADEEIKRNSYANFKNLVSLKEFITEKCL